MNVLGLLSRKGGSGKTTLAIHLAVQAQAAGRRALLIDLDPQRSAAAWWRARESDTPQLVETEPGHLGNILEAASGDGVDLVVIDTRPSVEADAVQVAALSDLVLIPTRPAILDLRAILATLDVVKGSARRSDRPECLSAVQGSGRGVHYQRRAQGSQGLRRAGCPHDDRPARSAVTRACRRPDRNRDRAGRESGEGNARLVALYRKGSPKVKKPTLADALAQKAPPAEVSVQPEQKPAAKDDRINTTLQISPAGLEALKNIAAAKRIRVNDLLLEGAEHVLALNGRKMQLRK